MAFDKTKLGNAAANQMEDLERRYGDDCELGTVCSVVEVTGPHGSETAIHSPDLPMAQPVISLLRSALTALERAALGGTAQDTDTKLVYEFETTDSERASAMNALGNPIQTLAAIAANNGYEVEIRLSRTTT